MTTFFFSERSQYTERSLHPQDQIGELKEKYTNADLVKDLPSAFGLFMEVWAMMPSSSSKMRRTEMHGVRA